MNILGWLSGTLGIVLGALLILGSIGLFFGIASFEAKDGGRKAILPSSVVGILGVALLLFAITNFVVPLNQQGVVIDQTTGRIFGTFNSGMGYKPLLGSYVSYFPVGTNIEECQEYTPSISGGYEVKLKVCYYIDTTKIDWGKMIMKYNKFDYVELKKTWVSQLMQYVAISVKDLSPQQLTFERDKVVASIKAGTSPWFENENMKLSMVVLANWDFVNKAVADAFDQTIQYQTLKNKAEAELQAAEVERKKKLYVQETENQVLKTKVDGQVNAMKTLCTLASEDGMDCLTYLYLSEKGASPTLIINSGGSTVPVLPVK